MIDETALGVHLGRSWHQSREYALLIGDEVGLPRSELLTFPGRPSKRGVLHRVKAVIAFVRLHLDFPQTRRDPYKRVWILHKRRRSLYVDRSQLLSGGGCRDASQVLFLMLTSDLA